MNRNENETESFAGHFFAASEQQRLFFEVPDNLVGRVRGPRVVFQTSRNWTSDCNVTTNWSERRVFPAPLKAPCFGTRGCGSLSRRRLPNGEQPLRSLPPERTASTAAFLVNGG
jgi:hypothetical protein